MMVIAVTGGIGSGKSTVVDLFREQGVPVIDTDQISRQLVEPGKPALTDIVSSFGDKFLKPDGTLDRTALRKHVFVDNQKREKLEAILHPLIHKSVLEQLNNIDAAYCLLVIPLLIESKHDYPHDRVLVIDVDEQTQIQRTCVRDKLDETLVKKIINSQVPREQRLAIADDIVDNNGDMNALRNQVNHLHNRYLKLSAAPQ